jgi:tetratricopeptide (TPR) repeat protein
MELRKKRDCVRHQVRAQSSPSSKHNHQETALKVMRSEGFSLRACVRAGILAALVLLLGFSNAAQASDTPSLEQQISKELALIHDGERNGLEPLKLGRLWAHLGIDYEDEAEFAKAESAYNHSLKILEALPSGIADYANALDNLGSMYLMLGNLADAERCSRNSLAVREKMGDRLQIARGKWHLAEVELGRRKTKEAQQTSLAAYNEMVALKDPEIKDLVSALITLTYAECFQSCTDDGVTHAKESVALARGSSPGDPIMIGQALLALGNAEWKAGMKEAPEQQMRESIDIFRAQSARGRTYVLGAMEQYRRYLDAVHRGAEAKQVAMEESQIRSEQPKACANCTVSVYGLQSQ